MEDFAKLKEAIIKKIIDGGHDSFLCTLNSDTIKSIYGAKRLENTIAEWSAELIKINGVVILIYFSEKDFAPPIHLASTYFKLEKIGENMILFGENPKTKIYAVKPDSSRGYLVTHLIPIE